jgi:tripartite-type tricarboxylate transporter receptor subunit TctC
MTDSNSARLRTSAHALMAGLIAMTGHFAFSAPAAAQKNDEFFKGRTISIYIGFAPGGSYDYYARLVGRFLGRHLPGNPTVVTQNMPGAGSFLAANFLYNAAPRDGTALAVVTQTLALEEALKTKGVQYRSAQFNWIGRMTAILEVTLTGPKARAKTIEDARKMEVPLAGTGSGSPSEGYPKLMNALAGTKFKIISGYPGSTQGIMAAEAGEVDGGLTSWNTLKRTRAAALADGEFSILVQYALQRHPDLPNVPTIVELGQTPEARKILTFYASGAEVGRSLVAPPGLPPERVKQLRDGFDAMLKDPEFLTEVEKTQVEFQPASGEFMQKLIADTAEAPRAVIDAAQDILK